MDTALKVLGGVIEAMIDVIARTATLGAFVAFFAASWCQPLRTKVSALLGSTVFASCNASALDRQPRARSRPRRPKLSPPACPSRPPAAARGALSQRHKPLRRTPR